MKGVLLYFLALCHLTAAAQELVFSREIEFKKLDYIEGVVSGDYIISKAQADEEILFYAIHAENNTMVQHKIKRQYSSLIGVMSTADEIFIYFTSYVYGIDKLECLTFSKTKGKFTKLKELTDISEKQHVCFINDNNAFYSMSYQKRERKLLLHKYDQGLVKDTLSFDFSDELISKTMARKGSIMNLVSNFTFIKKGVDISFDKAKDLKKVYFKGNKLLMISDEHDGIESGEILVLELDLLTESVVSRKVTLPYTNKTGHNSFFIDDKLFVVGIDKSMLDLTVFDIHKFEELGSHRYLKGELIQLKSSKLEKNGVDVEKVSDRTWTKEDATKLLLKSLNEGSPVISVTKRETDYRLLIGSYHVPQSGPAPMAGTSAGSTIQTPRGTVTTPGATQMTWSRTNSSERQNYFYGYLGMSDLKVSKDYNPSDNGVLYRAKQRIKELDSEIKLGGVGKISCVKEAYLLYMDKQKRSLFIERLIE
ncbi:hypothetical protein SanaruYs_02070 [Chryseotalea sanaruensis]|uniref:Uncharacterized protein n=1 Tax=Chryseotalea sanaruensis TaxID=2482724 RepID=A0A401U531_9BACT|nr:hypothetical protein [Chryseotalea sanaruensis]GCC49992.1 hypothetical protein SanaruYs_02070 [Chryseotalea sanaruensis]